MKPINIPKEIAELLDDLPELMTIPYVAKHKLLWFSSITTVRKIVNDGGVDVLNLGDKDSRKIRITPAGIRKYWEKAQSPAPTPRKTPARQVPRKRRADK